MHTYRVRASPVNCQYPQVIAGKPAGQRVPKIIAMPIRWESFELDRASAVPVYQQLAEWLEREIRAGKLEPGDRLPQERAWAELVGHSYDTARKATALLKDRGLLVSRQGVGTVVTRPDRWADAPS